MTKHSDWYEGMLLSVRGAADRAGGNRARQRDDEFRSIGLVERVVERGDGWFRTPKLSDSNFERLADGVLAPNGRPTTQRFAVLETAMDDGESFVRVQPAAPETGLELCLPQLSPARIYDGLHRGLVKYRAAKMAEHFSTRTLTQIPNGSDGQPQDPPARAISAVQATGLHIVWGPPGTGKTRVIAKSFGNLVATGKRCLLVSTTNIAVDNALERLLNEMPLEPGSAVRVGRPRIPELAERRDVTLTDLVRARQTAINEEIARLESKALELKVRPEARALSHALNQLTGFHLDRYEASRKRLQNADDLTRARELEQDWVRYVSEATGRLAEARKHVRTCRLLIARSDIADLRQKGEDLAERVSSLKDSLWSWRKRRRLQGEISELRRRRDDALRIGREAETECLEHGDPDPIIETCSGEDLAAQMMEQTAMVGYWQREEASRIEGLANSTAWTTKCASQSAPTPSDSSYRDAADARGLPALAAELPDLQRRAKIESNALDETRELIEAAVAKARQEQPALEASILKQAKVVATTMTQLILKKALASLNFDVVIVDEAAAVPLPQIVLAAGHADDGCTLLGDYMQNGPIIEDRLKGDAYWNQDVFEYFGLTSPASAGTNTGCVVLDRQYRFGQAITDYANAIAYQGILRTAGPMETDLVLVDVDGLPSGLTHIARLPGKTGGSWPVGALLSRALADYHCALGKTVGVVAPYTEQVKATNAALEESANYEKIEVGTAHSFQGREFDVVIFDTVDDGYGWIAQAVPNAPASDFKRLWKRDGIRLANVAVTRARERAYVIAEGKAVKGPTDTPLGSLRALCERNKAQTVRAASLFGFSAVSMAPTAMESEFADALRPYVQVVGVYDEVTSVHRVIEVIEEASRDIWVWSPWVGRQIAAVDLQESLIQKAGSVVVHAMVLPPANVTESNRESLAHFRENLENVVLLDNMHQKLIIADGNRVIIGSMNTLSAAERVANRRQEVNLELVSRALASQLLDAERADQLSNPPRCPNGHGPVRNVKLTTRSERRSYAWVCEQCEWRKPFPDDGPGRQRK